MTQNIFFSLAGGILPALVWLLFWLKEDRKHPEPRKLLALTFLAGIIAVFPVLKLESIVYDLYSNETIRLIMWSAIEEIAKFGAALLIVLRRKEIDEPIDYVVYMVTVALGFAAIENALFIYNPLSEGLTAAGILTGNQRFIGATLLHIGSSALIGISLALAFYKQRFCKHLHVFIGLILAIVLHASFNLFIMRGDGTNSLLISSGVWIVILAILLFLEKIKKIHPVK